MTSRLTNAGSKIVNDLLDGGFEPDVVTMIYGPAGSGKTTICLFALVAAAKEGKQVVFVDTEGGFSVERIKQIAPDFKEVLANVVLINPVNFDEQKKAFDRLRSLANENVGLIIIDSIAMLYRLELGKTENVIDTNRELGLQLGFLTELARKKKIPIIVTNQVYANIDGPSDSYKMVGGDIVRYGSKCLLELSPAIGGKHRLALKKHRCIPSNRHVVFDIANAELTELSRSHQWA